MIDNFCAVLDLIFKKKEDVSKTILIQSIEMTMNNIARGSINTSEEYIFFLNCVHGDNVKYRADYKGLKTGCPQCTVVYNAAATELVTSLSFTHTELIYRLGAQNPFVLKSMCDQIRFNLV